MKVGIIGGGAAGMMSAITAARCGHDVTIIEHNSRVGKKILATGNGRCNFTNIDMSLRHFHGGDKLLIDNVLRAFDSKKTLKFFNEIGVYPKEKNGCIYPYSEQASAVLDCLMNEMKKNNVEVITECHPNDISIISDIDAYKSIKSQNGKYTEFSQPDVFKVITNKGTYFFDKLIVAAGSKAQEKTGSDGSGYNIAKHFNHKIRKPLPALCSLFCKEDFYKSIAGIRCQCNVKLLINDELKKEDTGELQITEYGISGIPVFQISYLAARAIDKGLRTVAILDFLPDVNNIDEVYDIITERIRNNPGKSMDELLIGLFHKNLCILFNKLASIKGNVACGEAKGNEINRLCKVIKGFKTEIKSANSFTNAQVCSGGVRCDEIKNTLESKLQNGLYFAGEIIDVNGDCGGYNLQFAWSSGYVAGCLK